MEFLGYDAWKTSEPEIESSVSALYICREPGCAFRGQGADAYRHHMNAGHDRIEIARSGLFAVFSSSRKAVA